MNATLFLENYESYNTSPTVDNDAVQSSNSGGGKSVQLTYKCENIAIYIYDRYLYFNSKRK